MIEPLDLANYISVSNPSLYTVSASIDLYLPLLVNVLECVMVKHHQAWGGGGDETDTVSSQNVCSIEKTYGNWFSGVLPNADVTLSLAPRTNNIFSSFCIAAFWCSVP